MIDLIRAKTRTNLEIANQQLRGWLYRGMTRFKAQTIEHLGLIEAHIDFPEEEIEPIASGELKGDLERGSMSEATGTWERDAGAGTWDEGRCRRDKGQGTWDKEYGTRDVGQGGRGRPSFGNARRAFEMGLRLWNLRL